MTLSPEEQMKIICKGVDTLVNEDELLEKLRQNKPLTIKLGLDPSAPDIHLGHTVVLRKIRQMQELGHKAVIIIGDFTGKIGDPTGKSKGRAALSDEQVSENAKTYFEQIFKILDKSRTEVRYNSEWLSGMTFEEVIRLASTTTVARILERDDFQKRYNSHTPIGIHEFFYPLMQAYDSVKIQADIELGGTDQTFNVLMGRTLQKSMGQTPQTAIFMPILVGLDGTEKMSKSLGNYIGINESAEVMFKKVMELPDPLILPYYELTTDEHPKNISKIAQALADGENPRNVKYQLAKTLVRLYHSQEELQQAMDYYNKAYSMKSIPDNIPEICIDKNAGTLSELSAELIAAGLIRSKSELYRLARQGGIALNGIKTTNLSAPILDGDVVRLGKKRFAKLHLKNQTTDMQGF